MVIEPKNLMADTVDVIVSPSFLSLQKDGATIYLDFSQFNKIAALVKAYEEVANA